MGLHNLPFKVGQDIESRSFMKGYRGAWFRCKIKDFGWRNGQLSCALEYYDFPDEKITWEKIYQNNPADGKRTRKEKTLMLRPPFPPIYRESKRPDVNTILEVIVIVNDAWKVGDLVDWWKDGCYWSGKVAEVLGDETVKVELPRPPVGEGVEGEMYEASYKDLRSSLDWSLEYGWTVPTPKERENGHPCVQVIKPDNQGDIPSVVAQTVGDGRRDVQAIAGADQSLAAKELAAKDPATAETNMASDVADSLFGKTSCSDSGSSSHVKDALNKMGGTATRIDIVDNDRSLKKMKTDEGIILNSMSSDTLEAAILDLEELVNRVKWMKGMLETGMPLTGAMRPHWKFLGNHTVFTPSEGFHYPRRQGAAELSGMSDVICLSSF
ncbi:uncharacterized protein LOC133732211 isoform X1 [Rosa rugosa]|uniref:uncharacterized protein LOC133732211 isoform X1 n=2 Tax=Rosa rugosa TaxID=74645 RepID=UPI002B404091|nr:uncharacterized protein LOC133732211 isoform X1 [Rosa rugosa]